MSQVASKRAAGKRATPPKAEVVETPLSHELAAARARARGELAALVHLAELDAVLLARREGRARDEVARERHGLGARLSPEVLEAYDLAVRAGRHPAVARLTGATCGGCHVRLHATLEQRVRRRRGVAPCPHCLRLVYDPEWLEAAAAPQG